MIIRTLKSCLMVAAAALVITSCGSSKKVAKEDKATVKAVAAQASAASTLSKIQANAPRKQELTAKVKVTVGNGTKDLSTNGTLKLVRGKVIFISLVDPILGIAEVGRMEFTPDRIQIIDRINKQYVDVPYSEMTALKSTNVDFNTLQSLFWCEVFEPGKDTADAADFKLETGGESVTMTFADRLLTYCFNASSQTGLLSETDVTGTTNKSYSLNVAYSAHTPFASGFMPRGIDMSFAGGSQKLTLSLSLSNLRDSSDWTGLTQVGKKYEKADPEKLLKALVK